jgi:hypothetical protein
MKSMKTVALFLLVAAIGANLASGRAHAEDESRVAVNVPFDFVVGRTVLKAGSYKVEALQSGIVDFWSNDEGRHHMALMLPGSASKAQNGDPHFVFVRYGSEAFLSKIAMSADLNYDAPTSGREQELIHSMSAGGRDSLVIQSGR